MIRTLIDELNFHTSLYNKGIPVISDEEWDKMYFELQELEKKTGIIYPDSPTQSIQYNVVNQLNKIEHNHPMLSLEKTKSISELLDFINEQSIVLMPKMDGLTCSLRYIDGELVGAETRGDGVIGEDILHNAKIIPSIPQRISYTNELVVDGEIICDLNTFKQFENEYSNPRNFAAGSIRLLDSKECSQRELTFVAWDVIKGFEEHNTLDCHFQSLQSCGFTVVPFKVISDNYTEAYLKESIDFMKTQASNYPIDGMVLKFNNIKYGKSLGKTEHHFNNAIAFKFQDELYDTKLLNIEWTMGRTGILTPVAIVKPIEIEGAIIERASLHNITILEDLLQKPYIGQKIQIYRANAIIPQIAKVKDYKILDSDIIINEPTFCPYCGKKVVHQTLNESTNLVCVNPQCSEQLINRLDHFCGKKGLDIKGLSKATLEKLINWGWITSMTDIFKLFEHKSSWIKMPGFGEKSVNNILSSINESRNCNLDKFIAALGIPLIGSVAAKCLAKEFKTWENFMSAVEEGYSFYTLPNFGTEMDSAILLFDYTEAKELTKYLLVKEYSQEVFLNTLEGKTFVITGKLKGFKNRAELKAYIERYGGKVTDSVTSKTYALINNDITSTSSKNKKAQELGVLIITEEMMKNIVTGGNHK